MSKLIALTAALLAMHGATADRASAAPQTLRTGFLDGSVQALADPERAQWFAREARVGASIARIGATWSSIAPTRPEASQATDPAWTGYRFATLDAQIRAADAAGLEVLLTVSHAPGWAERPGGAQAPRQGRGSREPETAAFGQFMAAVARRYDGTTPGLPGVRRFQVWNEPNLNLYLSPQYDGSGDPVAPVVFRDLVNAGYAAVKAVQPSATVAAAGLAPYGDPGTKGYRTRPVAFLRSMLCLGADLKPRCRQPTTVDAISLHPYAISDPRRSALNGDDATIPDWKRITAVLDAARKAKLLGPRYPQRWVTEISYDSSPPDPDGVPSAQRARYIAEALHLLAEQGVNTVVWYLVRDELPKPSYAATYQSGMFLHDGRQKADAIAFAFPTWIADRSRRRLQVWWRSPVAGRARVQVRIRGRWRTAKRLLAKANGVRTTSVPRRGVTAVRVRVDGGVVSYAADVK